MIWGGASADEYPCKSAPVKRGEPLTGASGFQVGHMLRNPKEISIAYDQQRCKPNVIITSYLNG